MDSSSAPRSTAITVINLKGGVGKTHTAWLIAGVCQERGHRLLVVDTDTQGNITRSLLPDFPGHGGIETLFDPRAEADPTTLIHRTRFSHIDILPSGPSLAPFDVADQRVWEASDLQFALVDALREARSRYDYLVFDCPPRLSLVSYAALCASDYVVIPLEAADWGAQGIVQVTAAVEYVRSSHNERLCLLGYLVSRFKRARVYQQSYLAKLREHFGERAFDTTIPDLSRYEKSVTHGVPITLHAPASEEAGVARAFFDELERRIRQARRAGPERGRPGVRQAATVAAQ